MTFNTKKTLGITVLAVFILVGGFFVVRSIAANASAKTADAAPADSYTLSAPDVLEADDAAIKTADIRTTTATARDMPVTLTLTARTGLDMEHVTHVHAQFGGKVRSVKPELGDKVTGPGTTGGPTTAPTVLCVIESNDLAQAKAGYLQAKVQRKIDDENLARTQQLVDSKVLAEKFLLDAKAALTKDDALLEAARQQLLVFGLDQKEIDTIEKEQGRQRMDYIITSPRTGVVAEKGVSGGEIADPTINLFTIADTSKMWVWGDVYERDLSRVTIGQTARVVFTSDPDHPRDCTIDWISPVLDPNTHSIRVRGSLDNKDGKLLADMYGTMLVTIDAGKNAIVVPSEAVVRVGGNAFVFVQINSEDGTTLVGTTPVGTTLVGKTPVGKTQFRKTPVRIESVGVGFGATDSASAADQTDTSGAPAVLVRITRGIEPGQQIVKSGALGLFNEMTQH